MPGKIAPTSNKVTNGTALGVTVGSIAAMLQYFIPALQTNQLAQLLITIGVSAVGYFGGGWASRHQATVSEIQTAVTDAEALMKLFPASNQGIALRSVVTSTQPTTPTPAP